MPSKYLLNYSKEYGKYVLRGDEPIDIWAGKVSDANRVFYKYSIFEKGAVYFGWDSLTIYLNNILKNVIPEGFINEYKMQVLLTRLLENNAFAYSEGIILFDISLFDIIENEAQIASVLAHEASHIINQDGMDKYYEYIKLSRMYHSAKNVYDYIEINKTLDDVSINNVSREKNCDEMALGFINQSGYSQQGSTGFLKILQKLEINKKVDKNDESYLKTHPEIEERLINMETYIRIEPENKLLKSLFIAGEDKFNIFKKQVQYEIVNTLLFFHLYEDCINSSFKYHIKNPDDEQILYRLLEALRRLFYIDNSAEKKRFILYDHYLMDSTETVLDVVKKVYNDSIFPENELFNKMAYNFKTNDEVFEYFSEIACKKNYTECMLTLALYNIDDTLKCNQFLNKYLENENINHKLYAENFLKNRLHDTLLTNNSLMVFVDLQKTENTKAINYCNHFYLFETGNEINNKVQRIKNNLFSEKKYLYMPILKKSNFNDYFLLSNLYNYISLMTSLQIINLMFIC